MRYIHQTDAHQETSHDDLDTAGGCYYITEYPLNTISCGIILARTTKTSKNLNFSVKYSFDNTTGSWKLDSSPIAKRYLDFVYHCEYSGTGPPPAPNSIHTLKGLSFLYPPALVPQEPKKKPVKTVKAKAKAPQPLPFPTIYNFDTIDPDTQTYLNLEVHDAASMRLHNQLRKKTAGRRNRLSLDFIEWVYEWFYAKAKRKNFNIDMDGYDEDNITIHTIFRVGCTEFNHVNKPEIPKSTCEEWVDELITLIHRRSYWAQKDKDDLRRIPLLELFNVSSYESENGYADPTDFQYANVAHSAHAQSDNYAILGIPPNSSLDTAKHAYRKLALQHHPDKGGDPEMFKKINNAMAAIKEAEH